MSWTTPSWCAYDFLKVDERAQPHFHPAGALRTIVIGVHARDCYAWGATVHAPVEGDVVRAVDGVTERTWIHPASELARLAWNAWTFTPDRLGAILGST